MATAEAAQVVAERAEEIIKLTRWRKCINNLKSTDSW